MQAVAQAQGPPHNPNRDYEVPSQPTDSVSSLCWSPTANHLVATSWDKGVRLWDVQPTGPALRTTTQHDQPPLCSTFDDSGSRVFTGGCDCKVKLWNLQTNQANIVGQHDQPVRVVMWAGSLNMLVTGGWDKTLRYWDLRSPTQVHGVQLEERVYAGDLASGAMVVGTADRLVHSYDLRNPAAPVHKGQSQLRMQTRCISMFPDGSGYAIGSIEGRCGITYLQDLNKPSHESRNFAFKCHRIDNAVYSINDIHFHRGYGTFSTVGSDGVVNFWDKENRQRLKTFTRASLPVTTGRFNRDGSIFAYSVCYDWSKGAEHATPAAYVLLHSVSDEIKPKAKNPASAAPARAPGRR